MSINSNRGPVKSVAVVSTGTVEIHPEHMFVSRQPTFWWLMTSRRWVQCPINAYIIDHSDGLVLFDTGQDRASVTDSNYFPKGFNGLIFRRLARFDIGPTDTLIEQINELGYSIDDVRTVVFSHLHQDHIGGLRELAHAEHTVSNKEWDDMLKPGAEGRGFLQKHIDIPGLKWNRISFRRTDDPMLSPFTESFDLMGDGSLLLLPTPGHTPGSLSMLVRSGNRNPILLAGDISYDAEAMERGLIPGIGNKKQLLDTSAKLMELKKNMPGLIILPTHDSRAADRLRKADIA